MRAILAGYVVLGVLGSLLSILLVRPSDPYRVADMDTGLAAMVNDPADSWSRFNAGTAKSAPSWDADAFRAAAGSAGGGQLVRLPGSTAAAGGTLLDDDAVRAVIGGTDLLVVITPPSPLGAIETTRIRDNTMQVEWASPRRLRLIMVHGQQVYLPGPDLFIGASPDSGLPLRESMRTGDATPTVVSVAEQALADEAGRDNYRPPVPPGSGAADAKSLALKDSRAPTAAELAPISRALDRGGLYVDPGIRPAPKLNPDWSAVAPGRALKVAILPFAAPGTPIDYADALAARFPGAAVLVITGKWIESAGIDRPTMVAALLQAAGLGGFALVGSAPAYADILDWVTGIDGAAVATDAFHRPLPVTPDRGIPRWLSYLVLTTSLLIAGGFTAGALLQRRRRARDTGAAALARWHAAVTSGLTASYLTLVTAIDPLAGPQRGADAVRAAQRRLDQAYASLLELRGAPDPADADSTWRDLDDAGGLLDRPDATPSATMSAALRTPPAAKPARTAGRARTAARRPTGRAGRRRCPTRGSILGYLAALVIIIGIAGFPLLRTALSSPSHHSWDTGALRTTSAWTPPGTPDGDRALLQQQIGDRAMLVAVRDGAGLTSFDAIDLAEDISADYPNTVAFVVADGRVLSASIGTDARAGTYTDYSLIDDYYGLQGPAGGSTATLVQQVALLYDRLAAEESITGQLRTGYDPPGPPWVPIAVVGVLALLATAFLIRFATRRLTERDETRDDVAARREALRLRLSEVSLLLLAAAADGDSDAAGVETGRRLLLEQIDAADPTEFDAVEARIDALVAQTRSTVG